MALKNDAARGLALAVALVLLGGAPSSGRSLPQTRAESSGYAATSRYVDVIRFIRDLQRLSPHIRVETLGRSVEGRDIPLLVIGDPVPASPSCLKADGRMAVYIQANIHAGEVEGKEASLMLARDVLLDPKTAYLDQLIILIAPILNADGNERISPKNRSGQRGPEEGVGLRHNGQNLDLNRDCMKLETPEIRGMVDNVLVRWDPLVMVDCHTTNGAFHEETVTWSWPLNPNADRPILLYQRDKMLPAVNRIMKEKYGTRGLPYGVFRDWKNPESGWETFDSRPRYVTNYVGLRNRISLLDENDVHADFKTRVSGNYGFLRAVLGYCRSHREEITRLAGEADANAVRRGLNPGEADVFAVEVDVRALPEPVTIHGYVTEVVSREGGFPELKRTDEKRTYTVPYYADFVPKRTVRLPFAYLIPEAGDSVRDNLRRHGIAVEELVESAELEVEGFLLSELAAEDRLYQGHRLNRVKGEYNLEKKMFASGALVVRLAQPLGSLAASLLEPESDDGLLAWNFFDRYLAAQWSRRLSVYPVYRLLAPALLVTDSLP